MNNKQNYPANSIKLQQQMLVFHNYQIKRNQIDLSREKSNLALKNDNFIGNQSHISQKITKETQRSNEEMWKRISPSMRHQIPKYEQKIVYINNKAFIISNSPAKAPNSQSKVICLNSKSKNKNKANNRNEIQQQSNIRYDSIVQKIPNLQQCLQRKISILQNRIKQIQGQKQQIYLTLSQQIKKLSYENHSNIVRITQLEQKLSLICERYENKQVEISQLYKKLQDQRLQKQRLILNYETPVQKSINTHNFINLTLSQEVQTLQRENKTLKTELQTLKQSIKTNICSVAQFSPSIQENNKVNEVQTVKQAKLQPHDRVLQQSREIVQIDSEILNIEQLISNISQISDENKKLKQQVQQSKNQLQIKQALAVQTACIVQAIKNAVQQSISTNECHSKQDNTDRCAFKSSLQNIKEILTQIYQN